MRLKLTRVINALTIIALLASTLPGVLAQNATGSIKGLVKDPNSAVVENASVTATLKTTGSVRKLNTGSDGTFVVENLLPGEYEVKIEAQGFTTLIQTVIVEVGSTTTTDFPLAVGGGTQTIEVTGGAPVINTTDTVVGGIINRDRVENLPLNGRSFLSVAALEPGVGIVYNANSGAGNPNNYFQISVGGAPQQMTVISVDGSRVNDRITGGTSQNFSAETVQEFQISTLGFDLSAGTVSAGAVNIVSRTGSNNFHGSGFFFFRDHNMSAFSDLKRPSELRPDGRPLNPLCVDPVACERLQDPFFVRKQFGGTIGGPIKRDKLFFFANYERNDQIGARTITYEDPRLAAFNHVARQPQDGHLFGVRVDYTLNDKHTTFLRGNIDANDGISGTNLESTWIASSNFAYQTQMGLTSVLRPTLVNDFRFSYSYFRNRLRPPTEAECNNISGNPLYCFGLGGPNITFFGGLTIGTNVNVSQDRHPRTYQFTDNVNWTKGSHRVRFGANYEYSYSHGTWNRNSTGTFAAFNPNVVAAVNPALLPPELMPGRRVTSFDQLLQLPMAGSLTIGLGDPGQPAPFNYEDVLGNHHIRFYGQDAWQIFKGFTLNYGLAWSYESNIFYHDIDLQTNFLRPLFGNDLRGPQQDYNNFDPAVGFAWALGEDQKTVIRASGSLHHISPNVGFFNLNQRILFGPAGNGLQPVTSQGLANPEGAGSLSFTAPTTWTLADMLNFLPTARGLLQAGLPFDGTNLSVRGVDVFKTVAGSGLLDAVYDKDSSKTPYTIQVNVGVQREVMRNLSVSADYVMRRGVAFGAFELFFPDINRFFRVASYTLPPSGSGNVTDAFRVYNPVIPRCNAAAPPEAGLNPRDPSDVCSLGPIQYGLPGILSRYSALQLKVDKRFSNGFQLTGAYALSRYTTFGGIITGGLSSFDNNHAGHGLSAANPKHRFTASGIWDLPKYKGDQRWMRGILNDWQLSTIVEMRTGAPTTVSISQHINTLGPAAGFDIDGDGNYTFLLPGAELAAFGSSLDADDIRRLVNDYNSRFPAPPDRGIREIGVANRDKAGNPFPFIVLPENFAFGDSFISHDLRLTRAIRFGEKVRLNLIAEGFNIFNVANLTGFSGTLDRFNRPQKTAAGVVTTAGSNPDFAFGQATGRVNPIFGSGGPRAFQFAARLSF